MLGKTDSLFRFVLRTVHSTRHGAALIGIVAALITCCGRNVSAQDDTSPPSHAAVASPSPSGSATDEQIKAFSEALNEVKFIGNFSVHGRDQAPLGKEEYFILSAVKLPEADRWVITARIKYGNTDMTVPMTMDVKWADETPVITVDNMTIPGYGTFDARVLVHDGQYAGTWRHGEVGGHLMGRIEKLTPDELAELKKNIGRRKKSDQ
ncbi:MAG: hypothetical protein KF851_11260 [Pirellulaceae bacterium]|nr:hypothetical protein [Pirellulaceae bacterium]